MVNGFLENMGLDPKVVKGQVKEHLKGMGLDPKVVKEQVKEHFKNN